MKKELRYVELAKHGFRFRRTIRFIKLSASQTVDGDVTALGMFAYVMCGERHDVSRLHPPEEVRRRC